MQKKQKLLFITCGLALAAGADAGIRKYDPNAGDSIMLEGRSGMSSPPEQSSPTQQAPVRQPARPAPTEQTPATRARQEQQTEFPLGRALFFIKPDLMNAGLNGIINEVRNMDGLDIKVMMESENPQMYLEMVDKMGLAGIGEGMNFSVDSGAYFARIHKAMSYDEVVYMPPQGTKRYYKIPGEMDKFMRHVRRIKRQGGGER